MAGRQAKKRAKQRRKKGGTTPRVLFEIKLSSVPAALNTFEKIIGAFYSGKLKRPKYTGLVYGLNSFAALLRLKQEGEIMQKIAKLEKLIEQKTGVKQ
jgi:hypothetical protein